MDYDKVWEDFLTHRTVTSKSLKDIFDLERNAVTLLFTDECKAMRAENQDNHKQLLLDITKTIENCLGPLADRISNVELSVSAIEKEIHELKSVVSELKSQTDHQADEINKLKAENT